MKAAIPYIKVATAMILIGSFVVVNKSLAGVFPVFLASELRLLIGAIVLTAIVLLRERRFPTVQKKDRLVFFAQSFFGVFLFSIFMLYGLTFTTAMEGGIITSLTPAAVGLISFVVFKEKLRWNQSLGIACAVFGALAINVFGGMFNTSWSLQSLWGNLLILGAVVGEAVFVTFGKLASKQVSPIAMAAMTSIYGAALFLPFSLYDVAHIDFASIGATEWMLILYSGIIVTVLAIILLNQGMAKISAGSSAVFTALMPTSAIGLSVLFLHEHFYWYHFLGISLVFAGIALATKRSFRWRVKPESTVSLIDKKV